MNRRGFLRSMVVATAIAVAPVSFAIRNSPRELKGEWTYEQSDELNIMYGNDVVDELIRVLGEEIKIEQNKEITRKIKEMM